MIKVTIYIIKHKEFELGKNDSGIYIRNSHIIIPFARSLLLFRFRDAFLVLGFG